MHLHTFKWINQPDAAINHRIYCLSFRYRSTCFGHPHAHHQEPINCSSSSLWFYRRNVVVAVLLVVDGSVRTDHGQQHCYHNAPTVKPESAAAVDRLLMMGMRMSETCWAVPKRQTINSVINCCIWLVDSFEYFVYVRIKIISVTLIDRKYTVVKNLTNSLGWLTNCILFFCSASGMKFSLKCSWNTLMDHILSWVNPSYILLL